jgi:2-polyprenyl-6-hydroxyphenyl methylase/3-demethylubiquinone-9 3-methyltransferase
MSAGDPKTYRHQHEGLASHHGYLLPPIIKYLGKPQGRTLFEIGFGNASVAHYLHEAGFHVTGIEPSSEGVAMAASRYPTLTGLDQGNVYDALPEKYGTFDIVLSLEVVEHLYSPRIFAANAFGLLKPGGVAIISTPYNGWLKNIAVSVLGQFDRHHSALWDHGHIKFWSIATLTTLLSEAGFVDIRFMRVGRIPPLAKSMIATAKKP